MTVAEAPAVAPEDAAQHNSDVHAVRVCGFPFLNEREDAVALAVGNARRVAGRVAPSPSASPLHDRNERAIPWKGRLQDDPEVPPPAGVVPVALLLDR